MDLRFLTDIDWHDRDVDVLVDLRTERRQVPPDEVALLSPADAPQWSSPVHTEDGVAWEVTGEAVRKGDEFFSVLTLTSERGWSAVVLADAEEPGKFAMGWCTAQLPYLADALLEAAGITEPDRQRAKSVDWAASRAVSGLAAALSDPDGWVGEGEPDVIGWAGSPTWQNSLEKLSLMVRWAGVDARSLQVVHAFQTHDWDIDAVEMLWRLGVSDFEEMAAMFVAARNPVSVNRIAPLLDAFHHRGFTRDQVIDWCRGPLSQWFFNHPEMAARYIERGWTQRALVELCHTVEEQGGGRDASAEVLLWDRATADLPVAVGLFVEAGVARGEVAQMVATARTASGEDNGGGDKQWASALTEQLEMLAGLRAASVPSGPVRDGVLMIEMARLPAGYPTD